MTLRDLEYALAVDRCRSFSRAAEHCDVAQATLSGQLRKLEEELKVELFERDGRRIRTTTIGAQILAQARIALEASARIGEIARCSSDPLVGELRLGIIPTLGPYLLPALIPAVRRALPHAPLTIVEDFTERILRALREGELDAVLIATECNESGLLESVLFEDPFWIALAREDAAAFHAPICLASIDPRTLILLADGHCLRDQALALCGDPLLSRRVGSDLRASSLETVLNLVAAGYGATIVPAVAIERLRNEHRDVALLPLLDDAARVIRLVHRLHAPRRPAFELLRAIVASCAAGILGKVGLEPT